METVTSYARSPHSCFLFTDANSHLHILPGGVIITLGFFDSPPAVVRDYSERLLYEQGILLLELSGGDGRVQRIPLAKADDTPNFRRWLKRARRLIP